MHHKYIVQILYKKNVYTYMYMDGHEYNVYIYTYIQYGTL